MSKKTIILLILAIIILGGALGFWLYAQDYDTQDSKENQEIVASQSPETQVKSKPDDKDSVTDDFEISGRSILGKKVTYSCYLESDDDDMMYQSLEVNAKDYDLPSNIYDFKDDLYLRLTYNPASLEVYDCKVVNREDNEVITDISEENINQLFNIELGKTILPLEWSETITLSELKEGEIYSFTAPADAEEFPTIDNDTGKNCIVYLNEPDVFGDETLTYSKEIYMGKSISGNSASFSYRSIEPDATYKIMYKEVDSEALLKMIDPDEIIYLSKNSGDELSYEFEKYLYNDTDSDVNITVYDSAFGVDDTQKYVLKSGIIYEFDWMVDSIKISD